MIMVGFVVILTGSLPNEIICKIISIEFKVMTPYASAQTHIRVRCASHSHPWLCVR